MFDGAPLPATARWLAGLLTAALLTAAGAGCGSSTASKTAFPDGAGAAPSALAAGSDAESSIPAGLDGDASGGAPAFVGASRGGLHPSALPEDQLDPGTSLTGTETENRQSGVSDWMTAEPKPGVRIEGYADALSVLAGQSVGLHVSSSGQTFTIEVLRTGDYQGRWARLIWKSPAMPGGLRTGVVRDPATRMVSAGWPRSAALDTTGWPAGAYLAKLIGSDGATSFVPFVVRNATSTGAVLLVHSMATWQAYNQWGGPSTYRGYEKDDKAEDFELRSVAASFDRPYARGFGTGTFLTKELPVVATAERLGLKLNYAADLDLELHPEVLQGAVAVVLLGHSEYWSRTMRANVTTARDQGVNLAFLGANAVHRRIRLAPSPLGSGRVMINYKLGEVDPVKTEDTTADWGKKPHSQPQSSLVGSMFECAHANGDLVITDPMAWPFAGQNLADGTRLPGVVGPELDRVNLVVSTPRPLQVLAHSPVVCRDQPDASDVTWYSAPSGAGVFTAGTLRWVESMTSTNPLVRRVITRATERVLIQVARPRAGARVVARDNVAEFYTADGKLASTAPITPGPSTTEDSVDPEAAASAPPARLGAPASTLNP